MAGTTTKHALPYPTGGDQVNAGDNKIQELAERVDVVVGEAGTDSITPSAANTTTSKRINYSRTYPSVPVPFVTVGNTTQAPGTLSIWTGSADASGFTVFVQRTGTTAVPFNWMCRL
jgi:hypothetical protein